MTPVHRQCWPSAYQPWRLVRCLGGEPTGEGSVEREGQLRLNVEALAKSRDDPVRLRMVAETLARNSSGKDDPPLGPSGRVLVDGA